MVASRRFPIKTLLLSAGLSASLALLGCATNSFSPRPVPVPNTAQDSSALTSPSAAKSQTSATQSEYHFDWSSDRIVNSGGGFKTASFSSAIKPLLQMPGVEQKLKSPETSGGFANEFAKDLPSADHGAYTPNTPAVIGDTAYFLTSSKASANFFALKENGQKAWELSLHENGKFDGTSPAVGKANPNVLYAISDLGRLYAVNATTGIVISYTEVTGDTFRYASPFVVDDGGSNDSIYLASYEDGKVYRYVFDGSHFTLDSDFPVEPTTSANTGRFSASPVVTDNYIYVGSEEGKVFKIDRFTGNLIEPALNLDTAVRATGCMVKGSFAVDLYPDIGVVPCGSYLFKIRLNDSSTAALSLRSQSPLLELRSLTTLKPTQILGPRHNNRPQLRTTILRDPAPTEQGLSLEQQFGFKKGDFVRVNSSTSGYLYGQVSEISDENAVTFIGDGLYPIASPSPDPILYGGETVDLANWVVRPTPMPSAGVTPSPTPTPSAGADPVTRFTIGSPDGLKAGDYIRFPTLSGQPVVQICSPSNTDCEDGSGSNYQGVELTIPDGGTEEDAVYLVTVPGTSLESKIADGLADTRFVPLEKIQNQVIGSSSSTIKLYLGDVTDFHAGQHVRVVHSDDQNNGRFEYGVIASVDSSARSLTLIDPLIDAPEAGASVEIVDPNDRAVGRVTISDLDSSGNIMSNPVLRGNGQQVYLQNGNVLYELNYSSDTSFRDSANYLVLQSGRLEQSNLNLTAGSRSSPLVLSDDKLLTVDTDPSNRTGIFMNRVLLPLSSTAERLNDVFPILVPNSLGLLPNRAETQPVLFGSNGFVLFGGGNGVAYKLHKDVAW